MQQRDVSTMSIGQRPQDGPPQTLILLCPASRTQQDAAIRKNLRFTKLHGDREPAKVCKALAKQLPRLQFVFPTEGDMRPDDGVLLWIEPLSDWLDDGLLSRRQEQRQLASRGLRHCCFCHQMPNQAAPSSSIDLNELLGCCQLILRVITTEKFPLLYNRAVRQMAHALFSSGLFDNFELAAFLHAMLRSRIGDRSLLARFRGAAAAE